MRSDFVPNVPCGVERLKVLRRMFKSLLKVPNVPCGVESSIKALLRTLYVTFLMYRVELKVALGETSPASLTFVFLMHRVELRWI